MDTLINAPLSLDHFLGMTVIESTELTVPGPERTARRSWRERLFSRPWRPLVKTRTYTPRLPHPGGVRFENDGRHYLMMHPATYAALKATFATGRFPSIQITRL